MAMTDDELDDADWFGFDDEDDTSSSSTSDWNLSQSQTKDAFGLSYGAAAITSAIGAYGQASAQKQSLAYQASIARNNVQIAGWQASAAITAGQNAEEMSDLKTAQTYSSQRAAMAANGVDLSEGSASEVLASTKVIGGINATTIHNNALMTAWGYQVAGVNATNSANFYDAASKNVNPGTSAATSLLTSAGSVAKSWSGLSTVGAI